MATNKNKNLPEVQEAQTPSTFIAQEGTSLPEHLKGGRGLGNEHVNSDTQAIPQVKILQSQSPELKRNNEAFVEDAVEGDLINTVTGEVMAATYCVNITFKPGWVVWKKRDLGGGKYGEFESEEAAIAALADDKDANARDYDIAESHAHYLMLLDADGKPHMPAVVHFGTKSKLPISRAWNTDLLTRNEDAARFASVWILSGVNTVNKNNQPFANFSVEFAGWCDEELYAAAKKMYEDLKTVDNAA